jgi:outer membrane immunogenic protein
MRRLSIASATLASMLAVGSAFGADLPVKAALVVPVVFSWTGGYVGLNLGYSWGRQTSTGTITGTSITGTTTTTLTPAPLFGSGSLDGFVGGGQVGYNWQFGNWVVGFEGDLQGTGERKTFDVCNAAGCPAGSTVLTADYRLVWFGTDRARLGFLPTERVLVYGTGGVAYGSFRAEQFMPLFIAPLVATSSNLRVGWTAGAGVEVALDYNWSFKAEYLYFDYGDIGGPTATTQTIAGRTTNNLNYAFTSRFTDNVVRVGINYRFSPVPPPAVVAKY